MSRVNNEINSAGSGKSNSIAWLAHQLVGLQRQEADKRVPIYDTVIVVTGRKVLDRQIRETIKQFAQVSAVIGAVTQGSKQLREFIEGGKKIIITTVQKFPFILDAIGDEHRGRTFAIVIDEAHSSQGGRTAAKLNIALSAEGGADEEDSTEDRINRIMEGRIKAVQTLSRLNRAYPTKHDAFILDFVNDAETIEKSFAPYYRTTMLSGETDPNKLHDLKADLDGYQVYSSTDIDLLVDRYLSGANRDKLDPILDACVATYSASLDEDGQVDFKGKAKAFVRTYSFLASILPYCNATWERLSIFLNFLIPKLPAPKEEDLSKGILQAIDMDSYRAEVRSTIQIMLPDQDAEIAPVPTSGGGHMPEPDLDRLSNILRTFNEQFGNIEWKDPDKIRQVIAEEIPAKVAADQAYQNAIMHSDKQNARIEHDKALQRVLVELLADHTELFKQFSDNQAFKKWLADTIFAVTYEEPAGEAGA